MTNETKNIDIAQARAQLGRIVTATGEGQVFIITRYGKPVAELRTLNTATSSTGHVQMDPVDASAPSHRPVPEAPEHRMQQQQRDEILRGVNRGARKR